MLYVPEAFAHGYQTLADDSEVFYQVSQLYSPTAERGVRYNDPVFGIEWPLEPQVISDKDQQWPDFVSMQGTLAPELPVSDSAARTSAAAGPAAAGKTRV